MTATIIKFPDRMSSPVTVPADHGPSCVIILPIVRIERAPDEPADAEELALAERFIAARRRRRLRKAAKFPKLFLIRSEA